jgi:GWxTD domain-containing protein
MIRLAFPRVPPPLRRTLALALLLAAPPAAAQEFEVSDLFSNDRFFEESGILQGRGDVPFVADLWFLPGPADSTRAILGVGLSNSALRFVRVPEGGWRATYQVVAELDPKDGEKFERRWEKSVDIASFDESLLTGETVVFQADFPVAPGEYDLRLTVNDAHAEQLSRANAEIEVPRIGSPGAGEPVLLWRLERIGDQVSYVVHPSHAFPTPPQRIEFMIAAEASSSPFVARARLVDPRAEGEAQTIASWSDTLEPAPDGGLVAYGSVENTAQFGEYRLDVDLVDPSGAAVFHTATPLSIAGSAAWVADHWKDALSVIRYEATEGEIEILEDIDDPAQRIEAWACFWRMRDPVTTTVVNEGLQEYFGRIETANESWKSSLRPGYLSDRGRVYITLGPPNDIQSNPMPLGQHAFEVWTFTRDRQFQLIFVDRIGFNNYQLDTMGTYQRELANIERRKRNYLESRAQLCPLLAPAFDGEENR